MQLVSIRGSKPWFCGFDSRRAHLTPSSPASGAGLKGLGDILVWWVYPGIIENEGHACSTANFWSRWFPQRVSTARVIVVTSTGPEFDSRGHRLDSVNKEKVT